MPRPTNTADRRAQIVDALIAVMAKQGYDGASIGDVARKAGLAPGLVHYHFKSKLEILVEVVRVIAERHTGALDAAQADIAGCASAGVGARDAKAPHASSLDDPIRELLTFIDVHLGLGAHADPESLACWVLVVGEALREKRVRTEVERVLAGLTSRVVDILERGNAAKVFACSDVPAAAAALIALVQGYFAVAATARDVIPSGSAARSAIAMMEGLVGARLRSGSAKHSNARRTASARRTAAPSDPVRARRAR